MTTTQGPVAQRLHANENTFIVVSLASGEAVAELSDRLAQHVNPAKYRIMRPSVYLPTINVEAGR